MKSGDTAAAEDDVPGHTHRKSIHLKEMSGAKQAGGQGESEKGKQPAGCVCIACLVSFPRTRTRTILTAMKHIRTAMKHVCVVCLVVTKH